MKHHQPHIDPRRLACTAIIAATMLLSCGTTAFATETPSPAATSAATELFPSDVQTIIEDDTRQIIKTYHLNTDQDPTAIPRDSFTRDGWRFVLSDITMNHSTAMDTRYHAETVEITTDTDDLNKILAQLAPTRVYESEDGYSGALSLNLSTVHCEASGYKNSSYTITATREYPHLSTNDLALIPKIITDNGRTLHLEDVSWEAQNLMTVDYDSIPDSYRAIAKYTTTATRSVTTGYVTTAEYTGNISKTLTSDTVYTAYFAGSEINPAPTPSPKPSEPSVQTPNKNDALLAPILIGAAVLAALAGAGAFFVWRRNVKVFRDGFRTLAAKDKINAKNPVIDLSPLEGDAFGIELDRFIAKKLNGKALEIKHGGKSLTHQIAYEGNAYRIAVDFGASTIHAIY